MEPVNPYQSPATIVESIESASPNADGLPWESEGCSAASWLKTAWLVATAPATAFAGMKPQGSVPHALVYVLIGGAFGGVGMFAWGMFVYIPMVIDYPEVPVSNIVGHLIVMFVRHVVRMSIGAILATFIMAAIQHAVLKLLDGVARSYATTFRTVAYAIGSLAFLLAVPVIGCLAIFLLLNVNMRGLEQSQQCLEAKALLATVASIPFAIGAVVLTFLGI